ncbi:MAG: ATP-binding protein [Thermoproteota archaeon]|jgi:predicted ATPase|nr:ATP-binding protein [Thermoproteota archaeon]
MARFYVVSGGPCSGKTTLIKYLESKGFPVLHETARKLVEKGILKKEDFLDKNKRDFIQRVIFKEQIRAEESVLSYPFVFLDRSVVDGIAYYWIINLEPPREMIEIASKRNYECIFILEQLDKFEKDEVRYEEPEEAKKVHELIVRAYNMLGYKTIRIPVMPVKDRAILILKNIELL